MKHQHWIRSAAIAGVIALLTTGCSVLGTGKKADIDAPPTTGAEADVQTTSAAVTIDMIDDNSSQMTVYVKDAKGFVAPISLGLPKSVSVAKTTLEYMVDGGPVSSLLPSGFQALLPKGTKVISLNVTSDKRAIVDFSKEFLTYDQQNERKILEAITWNLTNFPTVEKVQLRVEGKDLKEMPKGKTPLDTPLARSMGINLEKAEDAEFGQSTPVTLYFLNQNDQNYKYYVPVTRLVKRTDNIAKAVVDQLIKGPDQKKGLASVLNAATEVKSINPADALITVDFSNKLLGADQKAPEDALKSVILSLTENTGFKQVQIKVDGAVKFTSSDSTQNYTKPVARPAHINPTKS
ncbi:MULTISPECIES: GerMN domain-containing protein [Paenibacillus]|uniref:GerMN domain-containing protein n=1 Tax=Paenibacillus violae TaxID=3077234 RepID=A0ABU3RIA3_9BACL|nr:MULTISPECIES: GerMN domain-containing protein [Paenibacillus]MDU0203547.1 GerMN domain-containing protein [Paenibacillus sp. PFR10]MEC0270068.1 GerMN domain-containing protein [Paenibacillus anseongense]